MTILQQVLTVAAVVLGTMTTRFLPFLLFLSLIHISEPTRP